MASQFEVNVVVTPDAGLQQRLQATIDAGRYTLRIERIDAQAAIANFRHQLSLAISGVLQNSGN